MEGVAERRDKRRKKNKIEETNVKCIRKLLRLPRTCTHSPD